MKKKQLLALALVGAMSATSAASMVSAKEEEKKVEQYERYDKVSQAEWDTLKSRVKALKAAFTGHSINGIALTLQYKDFVKNISLLDNALDRMSSDVYGIDFYNKAFKDINLVFGTKLGSLDGSTEQLSLFNQEFYKYAREVALNADASIRVLNDTYRVDPYMLDGKTATLTEVRDKINSQIATEEEREISDVNKKLENAKNAVTVENVEAQKEVVIQQSILMQTRDRFMQIRSDAMRDLARAEKHIRLRNVLTSISKEALAAINEAQKMAIYHAAQARYNTTNFIITHFNSYSNIEKTMLTYTDSKNIKHIGFYDDFRSLVNEFTDLANAHDSEKFTKLEVANYFLGGLTGNTTKDLALRGLEKTGDDLKAKADRARELGEFILGISAYYEDASLLRAATRTNTFSALPFTEDAVYGIRVMPWMSGANSTLGETAFPSAVFVKSLKDAASQAELAYNNATESFKNAKAKVEEDINLLNIVVEAQRTIAQYSIKVEQKKYQDSVVAGYMHYKDLYVQAKNRYNLDKTDLNKEKLDKAKADYDRQMKLIEDAVKDHKAAYDQLVTLFTKMFTSTFKQEQKELETSISQKVEVFNKVADELSLPKFISNSLPIVEPSQVINGSWVKVDGMWYYKDSKGNNLHASDWAKIDGVWYRFDANGAMLANKWFKDSNNRWYWLSGSGRMAEDEWVQVDNNWFYAYGNGAIAENEWILINGTWYYAQNGGYVAINKTLNVNGVDYSFDGSGALK